MNRGEPFDEHQDNDHSAFKKNILAGVRPEMDPEWHSGLVGLIQELWVTDPFGRPSAAEAAARVEIMLKEWQQSNAEAPQKPVPSQP
ncbi:unnamed protein product [Chrysoparadoxa australica]